MYIFAGYIEHHYNFSDVASSPSHFKSPMIWLFVQQPIQTNNQVNKAANYWSLSGNPPVTGGFPAQRTSYAENVFMEYVVAQRAHNAIITSSLRQNDVADVVLT